MNIMTLYINKYLSFCQEERLKQKVGNGLKPFPTFKYRTTLF